MLFKVYNQIKTLKYLFKTMKGMLRTMLCQFTFRNYRSYRDEAELSMQATPMKEFERSLIVCPDGQGFLPVAAVYGPNAGGKSNLLEALDYVRSAVARPIRLLSASADAPGGDRPSIPRCSAFEFDDVSAAKPTEFELYYRAVSMSTAMPCPCMRTRSCPKDCGGANWGRHARRCCSSARARGLSLVPRCVSS